MSVIVVDVQTGEVTQREMTPEEIAALPGPQPTPVPQQVTNAQGTVALIQSGLWPQVVAYVNAIEDPIQKAIAEVALYKTTHWQRNSPFLNQAATALNISQAQMDQLFIQASQVLL
jgi:hypothetical protein